MRSDDMQARAAYMMALLGGSPHPIAFDVALAKWRARNPGVAQAAARRSLMLLFARTVWSRREVSPEPPAPRAIAPLR